MLIAHGRLVEARRVGVDAGLTADDEVTYVREFEHTTLARLLVAGDEAGAPGDGPTHCSTVCSTPPTEGRRDGSRLEILIVQALARHAAGDQDGAPSRRSTRRQRSPSRRASSASSSTKGPR